MRGPNTIYIPTARVGPGARVWSGVLCVGSAGVCVGSERVFRYQHVGIGNAKLLRSRFRPTQDPNAKGFALRWNIGLRELGKMSTIKDHNYYEKTSHFVVFVTQITC